MAINTAEFKGKTIIKDKLVAEFCLKFGSTRQTCLEILKDLALTGRLKKEVME